MKKAYLNNIAYAIGKGYRLCIKDGEEDDILVKTRGYFEAKEAIECMDFTTILWQTETSTEERDNGAKPFKTLAWFAVNLWNDADETIYDYACNEYTKSWERQYFK
jgi:hypothetical protein